MSKFYTGVFIVVGFGVLLGYQNCGTKSLPNGDTSNSDATPTITVSGTVSKASAAAPLVDGCNVLICSFDSKLQKKVCFIPVKWDSSQFNDGDNVEVKGVIRTDIVTTCMAGDVFQVNESHAISP